MSWVRRAVSSVGLAVVVAVVAVGHDARSPVVLGPASGNPALRSATLELLTGPRHRVATILVTPDSTRFALFGTDELGDFEVGSLTKPMTAWLMRDAQRRGLLDLTDQVGRHLELGAAPIASVTLGELMTHRSGLGTWGPGIDHDPTSWERLTAADPYDVSEATVLAAARRSTLAGRGTYRYSNLGYALLGLVLEHVTDATYDELVANRYLGPLGMARSRASLASEPNLRRGFTAAGRRSMPWTLGAAAASGGVRSDPRDLALWLRWLLTDPDPPEGTDGVALGGDVEGDATGWGWNLRRSGDAVVQWKTGLTGGYAAFAAVDRTRGVAVAVVSDTAVPFDDRWLALLEDDG